MYNTSDSNYEFNNNKETKIFKIFDYIFYLPPLKYKIYNVTVISDITRA